MKREIKGKRKVVLGQGVRGVIDGKLVLVGNRSLLAMEKVYAIHIAKISSEVARQNLIISAGANIFGVALALGAYTNPLAATVLSNVSSLAVLLNSARLLKINGHGGVRNRRKAGYKKRNDRKGCLQAKSENRIKPVLRNMNPVRIAHDAISRMWFKMAQEEVIDVLRTHQDNGLSRDESDQRFKLFGPNRLMEPKKPSTMALFFGQFQNLVTKLLLGAGMVSFILGEFADGMGIFLIVVLEAEVGAIQERRAEDSLANLKKLTAPEAIVIRDGLKRKISANMLVPGDIILLEAGCLVF
ncbi:MAG: cation-transporting P-type ATPase [Eubacteriales bacterium]